MFYELHLCENGIRRQNTAIDAMPYLWMNFGIWIDWDLNPNGV
jgi:hypothetical protein